MVKRQPGKDGSVGDVLEGEVLESAGDGDSLKTAFVEFRGRQIEVQAPSPEQLVIIRRLQSRFSDAAKLDTMRAEEAVKLMDRALGAVCSVVVDPDVVTFLEDLWLSRELHLEDTLPLLTTAVRELEQVNSDAMNREQKRASERKNKVRTGTGKATLVTN